MASPRNRKHLVVAIPPKSVPYGPRDKPVPRQQIPIPDRAKHGASLKAALRTAVQVAAAQRQQAPDALTNRATTPGIYVQFESVPGVALTVESLESRRGKAHVEVVAFTEEVRQIDGTEQRVQKATVFVPDGKVKAFIEKVDRYEKTPTSDEPAGTKKVQRHHDVFDRVAALRLATLRALWTDDTSLFPDDDQIIWWEVWLRRAPDRGEAQRFRAFSEEAGITVNERSLTFDDRTIVLAKASPSGLSASLHVLDSLAELRLARPLSPGIERLSNAEQREYVNDVLERVQRAEADRPAVCVLDTGVNREHPLLSSDLAPEDLHSVKADWGAADRDGHGTEMAGLALLGDLTPLLLGNEPIDVQHRLESVKVLPPSGSNAPELYGALTAHAVGLPEQRAPDRRRIFSMAITAPDKTDRGRPTLWSSAIDALAAGRGFDQDSSGNLTFLDEGSPRVMVVSAGNVDTLDVDHLGRSDVEPVEDPGQAWNAITVGASTNFARLVETEWPGGQALAPPGELSPWSRTSLTFEPRKWPTKPDVVFEGGNVVRTATNAVDFPAGSLNVLTTSHELQARLFTHSWGTSAATAQVARLAARISAQYPALWPESIRGLLVHSAEWTPQMRKASPLKTRADKRLLVRRYGYGVPSEERALRSAGNALTLIHQGTLKPFSKGKMNEMNVHRLPWPTESLAALGAEDVKLRVTLSYFIEPNPSRRGQRSRYRYASHGLRFALKMPTEGDAEFRRRINKKDSIDGEKPESAKEMAEWWLGEQRDLGSLHSDFWEGSAADLAERNLLAVYPVSGWWKDVPQRDGSARGVRYSLIVSIETEAVETDLWTPVAEKIGVLTAIST